MKTFLNLIFVVALSFAISSIAVSQDNASLINSPGVSTIRVLPNQILDGMGFPTTTSLFTVLPGNNSTSGNGRAPQGTRRFVNTKYIINGTEMTASGFTGAVTSVGWRWNVPSPPAAGAPAAQSSATTGNLKVFLKDTLGAATGVGGTFIDTNGVGYTKVIDGTITIPAGLAEINVDVPVGGPGTGSYTPTPGNSVIVIFVYKTNDATLPTPLGAPTCFCTTAAGGTLLTYQSQTTPGNTGAASAFRPETRFGNLSVPNDVGVSAAVIGAIGKIISVGKGNNIIATVKNFGTATQTVVPVFYIANGGSPVGPVNTVGPIAPGGTEVVTFSGGNAFIPTFAGNNVIKVYTALATDSTYSNDTLTLNINVQQKITSYPYIQTFTNPVNWTILVQNAVGTTALWGLGICTNPDGKVGDTAASSNCYLGSAGRIEILRSPEMDFSSLTKPILNFYCAYKSFNDVPPEDDSLEVVLSSDGGVTFFSPSTVYNKSENSVPSLATRPPAAAQFSPDSSIQWRHETVNLANVAGTGNVVIGFRSKSQFGNMQWVDNVIVSNATGLCTDNVTVPGPYNCNSLVNLNFNTVGLSPVGNNTNEFDRVVHTKQFTVTDNILKLPSYTANAVVITNNQTDNPTGGSAAVAEYDGDPSVMGLGVQNLTGATTSDASVFTPDVVYQDAWFNVTYTGNDYLGYANYNIAIDISSIIFSNPNKIYIVKRTDRTGKWNCVSTVLTGSLLKASGLTDFCDFALAGDSTTNPLPVELASFVSTVSANNVTLNWATSSELNNSGFDVERSVANSLWATIGNVAGNGTTNTPMHYIFTDRNLASGKYNYRLKQIDYNGHFTYYNLSNEVNVGIPVKFDLSQNYPNPFNPSTKINYDLPFDSKVSIKLFDMSGKEVTTIVNEVKTAGYYTASFNASNLSSGVYFYRISAEGNGQSFIATKKMMLVK